MERKVILQTCSALASISRARLRHEIVVKLYGYGLGQPCATWIFDCLASGVVYFASAFTPIGLNSVTAWRMQFMYMSRFGRPRLLSIGQSNLTVVCLSAQPYSVLL